MKYQCTECHKLTNSIKMLCINCRTAHLNSIKLKSEDKKYKVKGYQIKAVSHFKSSADIINNLINKPEQMEVRQIDKSLIQIDNIKLNKYDRAKLLARKYKHLNNKLKSLSRSKIKSDAQVRMVYALVNYAISNVKKHTNKG